MAQGLPFTYGPSRTAPKSSTARAMGVFIDPPVNTQLFSSLIFFFWGGGGGGGGFNPKNPKKPKPKIGFQTIFGFLGFFWVFLGFFRKRCGKFCSQHS